MCTGLIIVTYLVHGSVLKGLMMALVGLLIGCVGLDSVFGLPRFTFGLYNLDGGVGMVPLLLGLFGISEVLTNIERSLDREIFQTRIGNVWPSLKDWAASIRPILRGSVLGFLIGILPGGGPILTSFVSYAVEKKLSKHPERFGKGSIEGVAGPESANNACIASNMMPLFSLGIPVHASMALLFSAIIIHGIEPGPLFIKESPDVFWGLIASMYVGNVFLLILNLPLIPLWVQILRIPYRLLFAFITLFCLVGAYSLDNSSFDLILGILFGVIGYLIKKFGYEPAPLVLAFVLGPMMERNLRQSLLLSDGSFSIFFTRPIAAVALGVAFLLLISTLIPNFTKYRQKYEKLDD
jgi:putative tricarboxylic transport membrane protein